MLSNTIDYMYEPRAAAGQATARKPRSAVDIQQQADDAMKAGAPADSTSLVQPGVRSQPPLAGHALFEPYEGTANGESVSPSDWHCYSGNDAVRSIGESLSPSDWHCYSGNDAVRSIGESLSPSDWHCYSGNDAVRSPSDWHCYSGNDAVLVSK